MESPATPTPPPDPVTPAADAPQVQEVPGSGASNSLTAAFADEDRTENQQAGPGRGEFGPHADGHTQGGYGNQNRGDEVYGGQVTPAPVSRGGYEGGKPENNTGSATSTPANQGTSTFGTETGIPPAGSSVAPDYGNDNNAPQRTGGGYSEDYGHSSLVGAGSAGSGTTSQRNQTEDYRPADTDEAAATPGGFQARPAPVPGQPAVAGANEHTKPAPAREADESRTGYTRTDGEQSEQGDTATGLGSRGGSYNDPNGPKPAAAGQTGPQNTEPNAE
ncbi:MAG: hypothetical protein H7Z21_20125 [Hymenobacter sp.]|nr:hypothetical protein [Hymenobacter sp.]